MANPYIFHLYTVCSHQKDHEPFSSFALLILGINSYSIFDADHIDLFQRFLFQRPVNQRSIFNSILLSYHGFVTRVNVYFLQQPFIWNAEAKCFAILSHYGCCYCCQLKPQHFSAFAFAVDKAHQSYGYSCKAFNRSFYLFSFNHPIFNYASCLYVVKRFNSILCLNKRIIGTETKTTKFNSTS